MFVGSEKRRGVEEACQHCCLSTHNVIGLLQQGWACSSTGAESGQLVFSGGTGRGYACVSVCAQEGHIKEEGKN